MRRSEEKLDGSAPDIIHMSSDDSSDNEENVEINQPRDLTTINYYPETLCSDRVLKIETPTDFTEVKEDMTIDSSTEPTTRTLEVTQLEYAKKLEDDKLDQSAPDLIQMSADGSSD